MNDQSRTIQAGYKRGLIGTLLPATLLALAIPTTTMQAQDGYAQQVDPPSRVARVSVIVGNVSVEPASVEQFNVAEQNYPMTTGDRIYADVGSNAEIQTGQLALRLGQQTDLTVTAMTDSLAQFGLAQGSLHLRSYGIYQGETVELDTPNVAVTVLQPGDVRVDVDPGNDLTVVTVLNGQVQVNGNGVEQLLEPGERVQLSGSNPVYMQTVGGARPDGLDRFSGQRDGLYQSAYASEGQYLNPGTIGAEDLSAYGSWDGDPNYGAVWYPSNVAYDWQPYRNGHWTWIAPWGWTWVEAEPWGFAPFHYGRWNRFGDRWGWIPGPPGVRPIYSPALVAFVGGAQFAVGGVGVTAWFPLGPGEVYTPWYHTSPLYLNRVNVSNIYDRNIAQVRNIYNQRTVVNTYVNAENRNYANRQVATVAMAQNNFASGRRADQSTVRLDARVLAGAQVLPHPLVTPERSMVAASPSRVQPPVAARPTLASHEDTSVRAGGIQSNAVRTQVPVSVSPGLQPAPVTRQPSDGFRGGQLQQPTPQQQFPQQRQQVQTQPQPMQQQLPPQRQPVQPQQAMQPVAPAQPQPQQPAQRPLFNKAVPPDPRPSFDQQREAIQSTDPGRPLSPQQLNNLRQNQPAGQPEQREAAHPSGVPAPTVAPRGGPVRPAGPPKN